MKTLGSQLNPTLLARSRRYEKLTLLLHQHLPPECDGHYAVTNIHQRELVIMADSPVWATRLRQLAPQILALTRQDFAQLQHVQIKSRLPASVTAQTPASAAAKPRVRRQISLRASQQISSAASSITDRALKNALLKLARHHAKSST